MKYYKIFLNTKILIAMSMVSLLSLVITTAMPQVVKANVVEDAVDGVRDLAEGVVDGVVRIITSAPESSFPVIGEVEPAYELWVLATAYSSEVGQTDNTPCIPAMHTFNLCTYYEQFGRADSIAANFLYLGSQVEFESAELPYVGNHKFMVRDRMNSKYNGQNRIDIWMPSKQQAIEFGARRVKIKVYPRR